MPGATKSTSHRCLKTTRCGARDQSLHADHRWVSRGSRTHIRTPLAAASARPRLRGERRRRRSHLHACWTGTARESSAKNAEKHESRLSAAGERLNLAGRTGLEPATSGVTGRRSRVKREELVYRTWIKLWNPRDLRSKIAKLASHLASRKFASFGARASCVEHCGLAWNTRGERARRRAFLPRISASG
jgi:hypothetical protein